MREVQLPDSEGNLQWGWLQEESAIAGEDGLIRTQSPPYPGVNYQGRISLFSPGVSISRGKILTTDPALTALDSFNTAVASVPFAGSFIAGPISNLSTNFGIADVSSVELKAIPEVGLPVTVPLAGSFNPAGIFEFNLSAEDIPVPPLGPTKSPVVLGAGTGFVDDGRKLVITGSNFTTDSSEPLPIVRFTLGGEVYDVEDGAHITLVDVDDTLQRLEVTVPEPVSLGTVSGISV